MLIYVEAGVTGAGGLSVSVPVRVLVVGLKVYRGVWAGGWSAVCPSVVEPPLDLGSGKSLFS